MLEAIKKQRKVVRALILREMKTRFGNRRLGYLWSLIEPVIHVMFFILLWKIFGRLGPHRMPPEVFLISGIVPFFMFRNTLSSVMNSIKSNRALLVFPQINMLDFSIARALLELYTYTIIFIAMMVGASLIGIEYELNDILGAMKIFLVMWLLGFGIGLFLLPVAALFPVVDTIVAILIRVMYLISGVIFSIDRIPPKYYDYISWNPVLHCIQLFRSELLTGINAKDEFSNLPYVLGVTGILFLAGLVLQKRLNRFILTS
ncbi:MAG: hypothetical protein COV36_01305 [Alphaproteobacteria bacterium CG11_big_fil_rev_8_21_14_0_20_44_7]|nr:MAG: hypothetical protein COV36_01305 [Alphaproteobacteria bacterium CG11_big_fil_rev_8_21_14_0_20_44_7]